MNQTPQSGVYGQYRSRAAHVADRRARWDAWKALPPDARRDVHMALRAEQLERIGAFRGITTDGTTRPNLFALVGSGVSTRPIVEAGRSFLDSLREPEREDVSYPIDAPEWRLWTNGMELRLRHGVLIEDLSPSARESAEALLRSSLSHEGFERVRTIMQLNRVLGEITGDTTILNERRYYLSVFGHPSADEPWGWQLDGHHLNVNCFVLRDHLVLTPCFMGAEPRIADRAPYPDARAFDREQQAGLELVRALAGQQREQAILFHSMQSDALPPERKHPNEGRMRAGAFRDNEVMPYEGIRADRLSNGQRSALLELISTYVDMLPSVQADVRQREIAAHLDETHFAWIGGTEEGDPFFYKVQSPVLLIEFDHHKGVFLDNSEPQGFHAHSVVRTPNGNDYGRDLLRQHYQRHPH